MKAIGAIRKLDSLGRIVIPVEFRKTLGIKDGDNIGMNMENGKIVLETTDSCEFCGEKEHLMMFKGKYICLNCQADLTIF